MKIMKIMKIMRMMRIMRLKMSLKVKRKGDIRAASTTPTVI